MEKKGIPKSLPTEKNRKLSSRNSSKPFPRREIGRAVAFTCIRVFGIQPELLDPLSAFKNTFKHEVPI